jgi:uncharacterized phage protein (TIGR01671 family)
MREIKFRAWNGMMMIESFDTDWFVLFNGQVCRDNYQEFESQAATVSFDDFVKEESEDCILMQYTGLKDANGTEIYEGDVVRIVWPTNMTDLYVVRWQNKSDAHLGCYEFARPNGTGYTYTGSAGGHVEVIGNIHESPELLNT